MNILNSPDKFMFGSNINTDKIQGNGLGMDNSAQRAIEEEENNVIIKKSLVYNENEADIKKNDDKTPTKINESI